MSRQRGDEQRPLLAISSGSLPPSVHHSGLNDDASINQRTGSTYGQLLPPAPAATHAVPRRSHSLHNNAIFALASAFLTSAFSSIYLGGNEALINVLFLVGALFLTQAFAVLTHWSIAVARPPWRALLIVDVVSTALKVPSALLLCWQPITAIASGGPGANWSNLAGIAALSVLNTVNAITMPILFWQRGRVRANLPIFGAWLFAVATYSMTIATAAQLFQPTLLSVEALQALQFFGALGYELGAWIFLAWGYTGEPV
jgi:hypothetical protein